MSELSIIPAVILATLPPSPKESAALKAKPMPKAENVKEVVVKALMN